jgi:alanyl-tRNA synthetase
LYIKGVFVDQLSSHQIRTAFKDYFQKHEHAVIPSAPLIPQDDPTMLFVGAGMVPFKDLFLGIKSPPSPRASSVQKCVRAGGKHNDLENVGYTNRHHTFFEMMGNFSFGDYFKEKAIFYAWDLLTKNFQIDPQKLWVTIYHTDNEARNLWKKIANLSDERIISIATSDNFWSMGDVGPCGPCTEIFYDHGPHLPGGLPGTAEEDGERYTEIWNLVFMQFDQQGPGNRIALPKPSIDTGIGLERLAAVLQGVTDNYDTDILKTLIEKAESLIKEPLSPETRPSYKVISDHIRAAAFLIADGILPSAEGRGYVLRRIIRRATRHIYTLGKREAVLSQLVPTLTHLMGNAYPELGRAQNLIQEALRSEEDQFHATLERGLLTLDHSLQKLSKGGFLPGEIAFRLYDTYGFPVDMTQDMLREKGYLLDLQGFERAMDAQRSQSRATWKGSTYDTNDKKFFQQLAQKLGKSLFKGYTCTTSTGTLKAILRDGNRVTSLQPGETGCLIFDQTPFYAESGGQLADTGKIAGPKGSCIVQDVQKKQELILHYVKCYDGPLVEGDVCTLTIDAERRAALQANHSVTHLLHQVLRDTLGDHVTQKGSLVEAERLRFDFSHMKKLSNDEINTIESRVNQAIRENGAVSTQEMSPEDALKTGALALFGEKYGTRVRVVSMNPGCPSASRSEETGDSYFSIELCGGTHVAQTGDIGFFKITSEGSVASGIRRIEAITGSTAEAYVRKQEQTLLQLATMFKTNTNELFEKVKNLLSEKQRLQKELTRGTRTNLPGSAPDFETHKDILNDIQLRVIIIPSMDAAATRVLLDQTKQQLAGKSIIALLQKDGEKQRITLGIGGANTPDAGNLLKYILNLWPGKGGGGNTLAQGVMNQVHTPQEWLLVLKDALRSV